MNKQIKIDQRDCWRCRAGEWPEFHVCESPMTIQELKDSGQFPICPDKAKKFIEHQNQQGIIENWREGWRDYANGDFIDPEPFIEFVLKHQKQKTRKETLEEAIKILNLNNGCTCRECLVDRLKSLINESET